jgi:hypothetical protein
LIFPEFVSRVIREFDFFSDYKKTLKPTPTPTKTIPNKDSKVCTSPKTNQPISKP